MVRTLHLPDEQLAVEPVRPREEEELRRTAGEEFGAQAGEPPFSTLHVSPGQGEWEAGNAPLQYGSVSSSRTRQTYGPSCSLPSAGGCAGLISGGTDTRADARLLIVRECTLLPPRCQREHRKGGEGRDALPCDCVRLRIERLRVPSDQRRHVRKGVDGCACAREGRGELGRFARG